MTAGERVVRVPPKLMGESRRGEREPGKSDQIDARSIARAVLKHGLERFPPAFLDEQALEIRLLCDHRETLVKERTRLISRVRWHLVILDPELEAKIPKRKLDYPGQLERISRRLRALPQTARVRIALEEVKRIRALTKTVDALKRELRDLIKAHRPILLADTGCGPLMAAILIGQTAGAERFRTDAQFARISGAAPIPIASGRRQRYRLDRGGNRQLNRALHIIALARARWDPATRAYLERKQAEGKTRREAIRCLKRQLGRRYHHLLRSLSSLSSASSHRRQHRNFRALLDIGAIGYRLRGCNTRRTSDQALHGGGVSFSASFAENDPSWARVLASEAAGSELPVAGGLTSRCGCRPSV